MIGELTEPPRVLVADPVHPDGLALLKEAGIMVDYLPRITRSMLLEVIHRYDGVVARNRTRLDREVLQTARRLKVIVRAGSGVDNVDLEEAGRLGIQVIRVPEAVADSVAELTMAMMLMLSRSLYRAVESVKRGMWIKDELMGRELREKTLGIIGVGNIGSRVARLAHGFGMQLLLNDIIRLPEQFLREVEGEVADLKTLLRESDYVSLHVPLTPLTKRMIGERELRLMKESAYLINTARGQVVDPDALYRALSEGWIAGAALDVYEYEPPTGMKLLKLDNVVCTPHIGAQTAEAQRRAAVEAARRLIEALKPGTWLRVSQKKKR